MELDKEILAELREVRRELSEVKDDIAECRVDIATLKTKSKVWGGLLGLLAGGSGAGVAKLLQPFLGDK